VRYLLDTTALIWMVSDQQKLNPAAAKALRSTSSELYLSVVSVWEIVIKTAMGRLRLRSSPTRAIPEWQSEFGLQTLNVTQTHALEIADLPLHHHDPFDRMLVAQALAEDLVLITADDLLTKYPVRTLWCAR
jgi:PIN domain nuclease of toxin-antitoxin system